MKKLLCLALVFAPLYASAEMTKTDKKESVIFSKGIEDPTQEDYVFLENNKRGATCNIRLNSEKGNAYIDIKKRNASGYMRIMQISNRLSFGFNDRVGRYVEKYRIRPVSTIGVSTALDQFNEGKAPIFAFDRDVYPVDDINESFELELKYLNDDNIYRFDFEPRDFQKLVAEQKDCLDVI